MHNKEPFYDFTKQDKQAWRQKLAKDLGDVPYEKLIWHSDDQIRLEPIYHAEDGLNLYSGYPYIRGFGRADNDWQLRHSIALPDLTRRIPTALNLGVSGLSVVIDCRKASSLKLTARQMVSYIPEQILQFKSLHLEAGYLSQPLAWALQEALLVMGHDPQDMADITGTISIDPFVDSLGYSLDQSFFYQKTWHNLARSINFLDRLWPRMRSLAISGSFFHNLGASAGQELAICLAQAVEYLHQLSEQGMGLEKIAAKIHFNLGLGSSFFSEIAKFRALRLLWSRVLLAFDVDVLSPVISNSSIHATTGLYNTCRYDMHNNILRSTTEAMSACLAGVDTLTILPFDILEGDCSDLAFRLAANIQNVLRDEAYLHQVIDPVGGSYYIDTLTQSLAQAAWQHFQQLEAQGGLTQACQRGLLHRWLQEQGRKHDQQIRSRKKVLVGCNQYPNWQESKITSEKELDGHYSQLVNWPAQLCNQVLAMDAWQASFAKDGCVEDLINQIESRIDKTQLQVWPPNLARHRLAEDIETLRLNSEAFALRNNRSITVYALPFGNRAKRLSRVNFIGNFFACAGFSIIQGDAWPLELETDSSVPANLTDMEAIRPYFNAMALEQPHIIALCSSDEQYLPMASQYLKSISSICGSIVVVAGNPLSDLQRLTALGVSFFVHQQSDLLATLSQIQQQIFAADRSLDGYRAGGQNEA